MTIVKIFKQEDCTEHSAITTLFDGEHIVGREKPVNCNDKRISRKHAIIIVKEDGVTLKSVHVNPCFFRTSEENGVEKLKKDNCIPLNDGDQFSMLANSEWFRVEVTLGVSTEKKPQTPRDDSNKNKRSHDGENSKEVHKRLRISDENSTDIPKTDEAGSSDDIPVNIPVSDIVNDQNRPLNSLQNEEIIDTADVLMNNLDNISEEESADMDSDNIQNNHLVSEIDDFNEIKLTEKNFKNVMDATIKQECEQGCSTSGLLTLNSDIRPDNVMNNSNENDITVQVESPHILNFPNQVNDTETESLIIPTDSIKQEPVCSSDENIVPNTSVKQEPITDENVKHEPSDTSDAISNSNDPSGSNDHNSRRDRCWYGHSCYRKNPAHRLNISHPGDNDYDSDPNDVRAICPYGRACYRINPQHRREFKHYGKPATKPNNLRFVVNVNNNCHCPQCHHKPGYESNPDSDPENEI